MPSSFATCYLQWHCGLVKCSLFHSFGHVNYEDPHFNVGLPVFTIHGNHDDPAGVVWFMCTCDIFVMSIIFDLLSVAFLVWFMFTGVLHFCFMFILYLHRARLDKHLFVCYLHSACWISYSREFIKHLFISYFGKLIETSWKQLMDMS